MLFKLFGGLAVAAGLIGAGFYSTSDAQSAAKTCSAKSGDCCSKDCCKDCPDCTCDGACCDNCEAGCECPSKP